MTAATARTPRPAAHCERPGPTTQDGMVGVAGLFGILRRRKWLIAAVTVLGTASALILQTEPLFTARTAVIIDPRQRNVVDVKAVVDRLTVDAATIATQIGLLQSRTFAAQVMDDLGLFSDPEFNPPVPAEPAASWPREWLIATGLASQQQQEPQPARPSETASLAREQAIDRFLGRVIYQNDGASYLIGISYTSPDRQKSALIANRIAELYVRDQLEGKLWATDKASGYLKERLAALKEDLRRADEAVERFRAQNNIVASGTTTLTDQELADLGREAITARADLAEKEAKLRLVRDLPASGRDLGSLTEVTGSPVIVTLRGQETELARLETELRTLYGDRHPRMVQLRDEKGKVAARLRTDVGRIVQTLENDVRVAQTRAASIEDSLGRVKDRSRQDRVAEVTLRELERQAASSRVLYERFLTRAKETSGQEAIVEADARIVSVAAPPSLPSTPGAKLFAAAGLTVSFLFGSMLALVLERLDRGLRSAREVETALGLTTLGLVPRLDRLRRNQRPHQYLCQQPLSSYAEAIRGVHTALKLSDRESRAKVVLVTSSLPGEGKTTLAVSLAALAGRSQKRVLIIDLDLRRPRVHDELGCATTAGIVEYIEGRCTLAEAIQVDPGTGLHVLPVKGLTTLPIELLESERMGQLLRLCREAYDLVVLDSAPVASINDTRIAATLADRVVFAVHWGTTIEAAARDSLRSLRAAGVEPAGAVLTQINLKKHARYGYGDIGTYYARSKRYYID